MLSVRKSPHSQSGVGSIGNSRGSSGRDWALLLPRAQIRSLVGELGSYKPCSTAKKKERSTGTGVRNTEGRGKKEFSLLRVSRLPWTQAGQAWSDWSRSRGGRLPSGPRPPAAYCHLPVRQQPLKQTITHLVAQDHTSSSAHSSVVRGPARLAGVSALGGTRLKSRRWPGCVPYLEALGRVRLQVTPLVG